jgi:hypothetical protein
MVTLSSTGEVLAALQRARDVAITAYTLPPGRILDALAAAAGRGARVRVRLEGYIYKDDGSLSEQNSAAVGRLRAAGADARLVHQGAADGEPMLHLKSAIVDGTAFLDDRNWPDDGGDTIVRDDAAPDVALLRDAVEGREDSGSRAFSVEKRRSLALEARLIDGAGAGDEIAVESESFGAGNAVYAALDRAAQREAHVRVLVSAREAGATADERTAIAALERHGVQVRACDGDEKFALVNGTRGWIGSSNATTAFEHPDQLDWGARSDDPALLRHLAGAFASRWSAAQPV